MLRWLWFIVLPLWRIWFYVLIGVMIVVLLPFLIVSILKESWYPLFFHLARIWARGVLYGMGFFPRVVREEVLEKKQSYILVSNHTSMTDIMLMLHVAKRPFVFVGKASLAKLPLFGFFYKRTCILVDRGNAQSRKAVFEQAQQRLRNGLGICLFPEGGIPEDETIVLDRFKDGAFHMAIAHQIPVVPMTFYDNKKRFPYPFFKGSMGIMRAKVHKLISPQEYGQEDRKRFRESVRNIILTELESPTFD